MDTYQKIGEGYFGRRLKDGYNMLDEDDKEARPPQNNESELMDNNDDCTAF